MALEGSRTRRSTANQPCHHPIEMRGQGRFTRGCSSFRCRLRLNDADGTPPVVEDVEDVGFAELDAHGPPSTSLLLDPLAIPVDAAKRDGQRDAALRPLRYALERGTDDPNQVAAVLSAEIAFELAT